MVHINCLILFQLTNSQIAHNLINYIIYFVIYDEFQNKGQNYN